MEDPVSTKNTKLARQGGAHLQAQLLEGERIAWAQEFEAVSEL